MTPRASTFQASTHRASCHCGDIALEITGDIDVVSDCDCSICSKSGFVHWFAPASAVTIRYRGERLASADALPAYVWGTGIARHHACPRCGIAPLRRPRLRPDLLSVNVRCIDGVDLASLDRRRQHFEGSRLEVPD